MLALSSLYSVLVVGVAYLEQEAEEQDVQEEHVPGAEGDWVERVFFRGTWFGVAVAVAVGFFGGGRFCEGWKRV